MAEASREPSGVSAGQSHHFRPVDERTRHDGVAVQALGVRTTRDLLHFFLVAQPQLDEFDAEGGGHLEVAGDHFGRVQVVGSSHAVVELGEQAQLDPSNPERGGDGIGTSAPLDIPSSDADPTRQGRRSFGGTHGDLTKTRKLGQQPPMGGIAAQRAEPFGALLEYRCIHDMSLSPARA